MSSNDKNVASALSRRDFLVAAGLGVASFAAFPQVAFADALPVRGKSADELWAEAVARAEANGDTVVYGLRPHAHPIPAGVKKTGRVSCADGVVGVPEQITAVAVYDVNDSNRIWKFYDAWVHGTQSTVSNLYFDYTIADGGRSLIVNYTATFRNYFGFSETLRIYASFGPSGGSYIQVSRP